MLGRRLAAKRGGRPSETEGSVGAAATALDGFGAMSGRRPSRHPALGLIVGLGIALQACGAPTPSSVPSASPSGQPSTPPTPTHDLHVAPSRPLLGLASDRLVLGRHELSGDFVVIALAIEGSGEREIGRLHDLAGALPAPWALDPGSAAASDTGYIAVGLGDSGLEAGETGGVAIFDLSVGPGRRPLLLVPTDGGYRFAGDRLWVSVHERAFDVYDLPDREPRRVTIEESDSVVADNVVPFFLTETGDAVLVERSGSRPPVYRLVAVDGAARPLAGDRFLVTTGRELPFGPGLERIRLDCSTLDAPPPDLDLSEASYCIDRAEREDIVVTVTGELADVAWHPTEGRAIHVTSIGLGSLDEQDRPRLIVRFDGFRPSRIVGFSSNHAIVAPVEPGPLVQVFTSYDLMTIPPLPPETVEPLPGDVLLRVVPW